MADRLKGITIEIAGNTTKLSESLKNVNKSIKETQSQLKDVDKLLKMDPKNIELLAQKQELLGRATEQTKEKLEKLKEAQQQMLDSGVDEMSDQYMALSREITETEQSMSKLEEATKETDTAIVKTAGSLDKVAEATGKLSEKTSKLSKAAAGALGGLVGMGIKAAKDADDLNTLAKQTGLSTESLQKMQYAADLIDVDVDDITGAIKKMKKQLDSGADKFEAIGVRVKDTNGEYRDTEEIFNDVVVALGQINNETERDIAAMDIFGKSADSLAGILDDSGQALKALGDEAMENGSIISQEDLDRANQLNDTLDKLKAQLAGNFGQAAVSVAEEMAPLLEKLAGHISTISEKLSQVDTMTVKIVAIVLAIVAVLSPLLGLISSIATVIPIITVAIGALTSPIGLVVVAITALIATTAVLITHWDELKAEVIDLGNKIKESFINAKDRALSAIKTLVNGVKSDFNSIKSKVIDVVNNIKNAFANLKLKLPEIKLPHFSIDGELSLNPPSVPKLSIDWYRKAYDDAYILNSPTIFGMSGGKLLGGGEGNGAEAVVGTEKLMSMISDAVGSQRVNVSVYLEGDAQGLFKSVKTTNNKLTRASGYNQLARG